MTVKTNGAHMALAQAIVLLLIATMLPLPASGAETNAIRLTPVIIHDPQINNVEALRFLAPTGWKTEGGIVWNHNTWLLAMLQLRISDPASKASIAFYPADTFTWSQGAQMVTRGQPGGRYMGSLVMQLPDRVTDTIDRMLVPAFQPQLRNAKVTQTEDLPELAKIILAQNQEAGFAKTCQAARVRFEYNDTDGTPLEEDMYAVVIKTPMPQIQTISWHLERTYSARAEKGKLDALRPVLATMITSARFGENWVAGYSYVVQLRNNGNMQAIADAGALSRHIAQNAEEMRQMNRQAYENQQRVQDSTSRAFSQTIRGVEDYNVPGGGAHIELPSGYNHAWYDRNAGEYVLSNDANFDPNRISDHSWAPIERTGR